LDIHAKGWIKDRPHALRSYDKNGAIMNNKQYRMRELLSSADGHSLVVDTSNGLVLGALPGLEHFSEAVNPLLPLLDGIVTSPGQARNLGSRTHQEASLVIRADWTNALRGDAFVLPPENIQYLPLLNPAEALDLGANALVMHFILGYQEEIEAQCLKRVVDLALDGINLGMPLLVDVQPIGPRVVLLNKAIELGTSYALEGGADGIVVPWPGAQSFESIQAMCSGLPVWVKPGSLELDSVELSEALQLGAVGFWLDEAIFTVDDPPAILQAWKALVHAPVRV
jgi:DhnA family fructose-bisphosphate aldolase class Ia